ncbi:MAG: CapA family protein [Bacteroidales bacterium]|nr:CapA family protein [Bacteroidales bacterium]
MRLIICGDYIVGDNVPPRGIFGDLQPYLDQVDYSFYNQEHPITSQSKIYPTKAFGPTGACQENVLAPILLSGFTCATLANNHIFNRGMEGLADTLSFFQRNEIKTVGAGRSLSEAKEPLILKKYGIQLAILNFAETEFNIATYTHGGANPLDIIENSRQIKLCKEKYGNVLVVIHGGVEYCSLPTSRMVNQYRYYAECGASAIVCHHSHVVSAFEEYNGVPIFYGLGNFIPYKYSSSMFSHEDFRTSISVELSFENKGIIKYDYIPFLFDTKQNKLIELKDEKLKKFRSKQMQLNFALKDLENLDRIIYTHFLTESKSMYYKLLFTRSNYWFYKLFRKVGLLKLYYPYIKRRMRLNKETSGQWNIHRCESHRDILALIFNNEIDVYKN